MSCGRISLRCDLAVSSDYGAKYSFSGENYHIKKQYYSPNTKKAAIHVGSLYVGSCHAVLNYVSRFQAATRCDSTVGIIDVYKQTPASTKQQRLPENESTISVTRSSRSCGHLINYSDDDNVVCNVECDHCADGHWFDIFGIK